MNDELVNRLEELAKVQKAIAQLKIAGDLWDSDAIMQQEFVDRVHVAEDIISKI